MPTNTSLVSGYSFQSWPAVPTVFEGIVTPARLFIPLSAHPARETAQRCIPGRSVAAGERIAAPTEGGHVPLAVCAGKIVGTTERLLVSGTHAPVVEVEAASAGDTSFDPIWSASDDMDALETLLSGPSEAPGWIERLRDAGVWASRRTSPDLLGQLHQSLRRPVDTVLCSILDADPAACLNAALAAQYPLELVAGVALLRRITRARRAWAAFDSRIPISWISAFRRAATSHIKLLPTANVYPQADPTLLVYTFLGRRLRPARLPTEQGVIIVDAAAAIAVGRVALAESASGAAMLSVPLSVRDHALRQSFFIFAPIGATIADVVRQSRISDTSTVFRAGDVLCDLNVPRDAVVSAGELILHASPPEPAINPDPCIRCGWCVDSCPTRVQPAGVLEAAQHDDVPLAESYGIEACIECGICSYVCPSRLPLLPSIRQMRQLQERGSRT